MKRRLRVVAACTVLCVVAFTFFRRSTWVQVTTDLPYPSFSRPNRDDPSQHGRNTLLPEHGRFWRDLHDLLEKNKPQCERKPSLSSQTPLDVGYRHGHHRERPDILHMEEEDLGRLKQAHARFVDDVETSGLRLVRRKGTKGIITTVSDAALPVLLLSVRMIRATQTTMPIEVFLWNPAPHTEHFCRGVLDELNVKCIYLKQIFNEASRGAVLNTYQFKVFAILFSSFEQVLFLDADAWPALDPSAIFESEPFTTAGLVLWPDFWYASESRHFFHIAGIHEIPPLASRASTEAGVLMYDKSKHERSILLAAYYNYFGPDYYYPLQAQGAPGQGDKETFLMAALALTEDYYTVSAPVTAMGRADSSGEWHGSAMVQYDPIWDYQWSRPQPASPSAISDSASSKAEAPLQADSPDDLTESKASSSSDIVSAAVNFAASSGSESDASSRWTSSAEKRTARPLFIHANFPKFDPRTIFSASPSPTRDRNGTFMRPWSLDPPTSIRRFGYDLEARFWSVIRTVACHDLVPHGARIPGAGGDRDTSEAADGGLGASSTITGDATERETCMRVREYVDVVFPGLTETDAGRRDGRREERSSKRQSRELEWLADDR